jgi:hypothetical protein
MVPEVITKESPGRVVAFGRTNSPWYYWVTFTHLAAKDILAYRVEQARKDGLWGSATLKKAMLDVLDEGDEPTVILLEDGLTMGQAMERTHEWIADLREQGHPLLNRWRGYRVTESAPFPESDQVPKDRDFSGLRIK